jgi:hypothetical protein
VTRAEVDDGSLEGPVLPVQAGPEQQVMSKITNAELLKCIEQLGDDQRECIALRFLQGMSVAETAQLMHRNEGAIKALQHRPSVAWPSCCRPACARTPALVGLCQDPGGPAPGPSPAGTTIMAALLPTCPR